VDAHRPDEAYHCAVALVRPDGIVAWRADACPEDADALVDQVTGRTTAN